MKSSFVILFRVPCVALLYGGNSIQPWSDSREFAKIPETAALPKTVMGQKWEKGFSKCQKSPILNSTFILEFPTSNFSIRFHLI